MASEGAFWIKECIRQAVSMGLVDTAKSARIELDALRTRSEGAEPETEDFGPICEHCDEIAEDCSCEKLFDALDYVADNLDTLRSRLRSAAGPSKANEVRMDLWSPRERAERLMWPYDPTAPDPESVAERESGTEGKGRAIRAMHDWAAAESAWKSDPDMERAAHGLFDAGGALADALRTPPGEGSE